MMATATPTISNRKARIPISRSSVSSRQPVTTSTSQPPVVIELGNAFLRAGFAGEANPRCILKSTISLLPPTDFENKNHNLCDAQKSVDEWELILTPLLENICVDHLLIRPRNHRVLLLEPTIAPTSFRQAITKVLLKTMQVPSLLFISDPAISTLHAHGFRYGVVLDMGHYETRTVGSFNGRSLPNTFQAVPIGYESVLTYFRDQYNSAQSEVKESVLQIPDLKDARSIMEQCLSKISSEQMDSNIAIMCNVPSTQKKILVNSDTIIHSWKNTCFDILNPNSITYVFLSTILVTPIDLRKVLLSNICLVGGGPSVFETLPLLFPKMFFDSFHIDILKDKENSQFQSLIPCLTSTELKDAKSMFSKSLMNWVGGSIQGASMGLNDERWVHRNVYLGDEGGTGDEVESGSPEIPMGDGEVFDWMSVGK